MGGGNLEHSPMDSLEYDGSVVQLPKTEHIVSVHPPHHPWESLPEAVSDCVSH